jgi:hypothetical protein
MTKAKKKIDLRVPNPLPLTSEQFFQNFFNELPNHIGGMYSIDADEVKTFKKLSADDETYVEDVITEMNGNNDLVATNVKVNNVKNGKIAARQFGGLGKQFEFLANYFLRNEMQADSFSYQHAAVYEDDVDNALRLDVKGANEVKERLEANRPKRNASAAATRAANEARRKDDNGNGKAANGG